MPGGQSKATIALGDKNKSFAVREIDRVPFDRGLRRFAESGNSVIASLLRSAIEARTRALNKGGN